MLLARRRYVYQTICRVSVGIALVAIPLLVAELPAVVADAASAWSSPAELAAPDGGGVFSAVSCTDQLDCVAVGYEVTYPNDELTDTAIYAIESDGVWSQSSVLDDPSASSSLSGISCPDVSNCTAVGADSDGGMVVTESNGVWGTPTGFNYDVGGLTSVSCSDALDCTATAINGYDEPFVVSETNGVWGTPQEIIVPNFIGYLYGVSCPSVTNCTAVGEGGHGALIVTESNGVWGPEKSWKGAGRGATYMSVSCSDPSDCTAVGDNENFHPIYATKVHGAWSPPTAVKTIYSGELLGVSCAQPNQCTAVGNEANMSAPMFMIDSRGRWGAPTDLQFEGQGGGSFLGVDCVSVKTCTAVGRGPAPDYPGEPMVAAKSKVS